MFETSAILSMLGMGAQGKGANRMGGAASSLIPVLQAGADAESGQGAATVQQQLVPGGSVFQLMLSYALPQADAAAAKNAAGGETSTTAVVVHGGNGKTEQRTDDGDVTASMMMPFSPSQFNMIAAALQVRQDAQPTASADAAAETSGDASGAVAAARSARETLSPLSAFDMLQQQPVLGQDARASMSTFDLLRQQPVLGQDARGASATNDAAASAAQTDGANAAVLQLMKQQAPIAPDAKTDAAIAEMMKQQAASAAKASATNDTNDQQAPVTGETSVSQNDQILHQGSFDKIAVDSALEGEKIEKKVSFGSGQGSSAAAPADAQPAPAPAETPAASRPVGPIEKILTINETIAAALEPTLAKTDDDARTKHAAVPVTTAAAEAHKEEIGTKTTPTQLSTREAVVQNNSAAAKISDVTISATVSQRGESEPSMLNEQTAVAAADTARTAAAEAVVTNAARAQAVSASEVQVVSSDKPVAPVESIPTSAPVAAAPRKFNAAHAWAESVVRKIESTQGERAARAVELAPAGTTIAGERTAPRMNVSAQTMQSTQAIAAETAAGETAAVTSPAEQLPTQVQQKIAAAPELHGALHETVARIADTDSLKSASKASQTTQTQVRAAVEGTEAPVTVQAGDKIQAVPAAAQLQQAADTLVRTREAVQTPSRTEQVQEVRVTKAEAPTTQPLVNVADVQRQFVSLHEAAATTVTPRMREEVFEKIYKEVSAIKHTPTSVNVTLSPESMGTVTVKVGMEEGKMTARIDVQNVEVKHIIESNMPKLQDVLQSNGVSLDTVGVFVNTGSSFADKRQEAAKRKTGGAAVRIDDGFEPLNTVRDAKQYGYNTVEYIM